MDRRAWVSRGALGAWVGLVVGACFSGTFLAGQPCASDRECGPSLRCEGGLCGGATGSTGSTGMSGVTASAGTTGTTDMNGMAEGTASEGTTATASEGTTATVTTGEELTTDAETTVATSDDTTSDDTTSDGPTTGPGCGLYGCRDLDILVIVDNSPSMGGNNEAMLSIFFAFAEKLLPALKQACTVHIGFATTDDYAHNPEPCRRIGALVQADTNGEPCVFVEGHPYATAADLDDPASFACAALVGTQGHPDERPIDALISAFTVDVNLGCNDGFIRSGAELIVFLVTDEDDGDPNDPQGHAGSTILSPNLWYGALAAAKGGAGRIYVGAYLGDEDQEATACPWDPLAGPDGTGAAPAPILRGFIEQFPETHRTVGSVCEPQATAIMDLLLEDLEDFCGAG